MERKLREVCKVQKYGSISADYQERIPAKARDLEQKIRALMDRTSLQMHQVQTRKEAERLADSFMRDYNRICAEQEREISALNQKFHQISRDYLLSEEDITKVYRPKNMTEAALLSSVSGSVAQELQRSYDAVVIALSQLHTPSGTLSRQVESLHRDIVECAAEL